MSVAYLLPSNRPALWQRQLGYLRELHRSGTDETVMSAMKGMTAALRDAFNSSDSEIVRNCADDDDYNLPGSIRAVEIMEADPSIDVMVTGGVKTNAITVCVPKGENYGGSLESVAWYGACGSGLFMRSEAVRKYSLLDYDGRLIDNYIVLKAIKSGANVKFCRLDTYRHHMSLRDMRRDVYAKHQREKRALRESFGIWGVPRRSHEVPPVWDGAFA